MSKVELRVWWIPQIPMTSFIYPVQTIEDGKMLLDALGKYDLFQLEHNVKPDYSNAGGMAWRHPVHTEGEWYDFDPDDEYECEEVADFICLAIEESNQ